MGRRRLHPSSRSAQRKPYTAVYPAARGPYYEGPIQLRNLGKYRKAAQVVVSRFPRMDARGHLRAAAKARTQARRLDKLEYLATLKPSNAGKWRKTSDGMVMTTRDSRVSALGRRAAEHRLASKLHRLAAAYLVKKRLGSNTKYYRRYR